jgi:hypothetical protein
MTFANIKLQPEFVQPNIRQVFAAMGIESVFDIIG